MKRILGHVVSLLVTGLAVSAALPACTENDQSVFVRGVLAPSLNRQNNFCTYTDDPQQPQLFSGVADFGVRDTYRGVLLVGNQMIGRGDPAGARAEPNRVHIDGGIVRVTDPNGGLIREFTATASGFADPQSNNTPDYGVVQLTLLDAPTRDLLLPTLTNRAVSRSVNANVRIFGRTLSGTAVESSEFIFPIRVCNGCLVTFPPGSNDATSANVPNCDAVPLSTGEQGPCQIGQDEPVPCTSCRGLPACDPKVFEFTTP